MEVKTKIKKMMEAKHLSSYALAQASDLTQTCIANWYSKRNYEPSLAALKKVSKALNVSLAQLFCEEDENIIFVDKEFKSIYESWLMLSVEQRFAIKTVIESYKIKGC